MTKKIKTKETEPNPWKEDANHFSNAVFHGWLNLEKIHNSLAAQLEACERAIISVREQKEWSKKHNPKHSSIHLKFYPELCDCWICAGYKKRKK
jgi:hypothetical protein